jgi:serine/threonine protein kinase/tetratricopeptide (TPR) repeat protein
MVGRTLSHYKILEELSRGGMGIVYRAVDLKLDREVALKVLPPELVADPERKRRFIQEAKAAAKLEHPHIGVVHEIDEVEGVTFIAMELIEGEMLRDVLQKERLPLTRSLELATEVAEGLARAHDKGIVHRDLKPANIMVTEDGHAKIIDFGLAKLVEPPAGGGSEALTAAQAETDSGKVMGTVSYMSPEQARGQKVDHRTDIFSFGIVLYEMLAGEPPFKAPSGPETLSAIINSPAPPLGSSVPGDVAPEIERIVDKCLAKDRAERYQGMKDLIVDLRAARRRLESGSVAPVESATRRRPWLHALAGAGAALLLAAVILWFLFPVSREEVPITATRPSLAVLYFENTSGDPELDWLRVGLADMLVTDLSQSVSLDVLSMERLYQILRDMDLLDEPISALDVVQEIAQNANAKTVVLGSFMQAGENIRINVRIQDATSGKILSTEKVDGVGESSIFSMMDDLTRRIKTHFDIQRAAEPELDQDLQEVTTSSVEAYRYYVQAHRLVYEGRALESIPLLEKALELDPGFASAINYLSFAHLHLGHIGAFEYYAEQAFQNRERLPPRERLFIEGNYYGLREETYDRAITAYEKSIEVYPDDEESRNDLAWIYVALERFDEANEHLDLLVRRKTPYVGSYTICARSHAFLGEFEKGYQVLLEFLIRNPDNARVHRNLGIHLTRWGKLDEALEAFQKAETLGEVLSQIHLGRWLVFILNQQWNEAEEIAKQLAASEDPVWRLQGSTCLSLAHLYVGKSEEAVVLLDQAAQAFEEPGLDRAWTHNTIAQVLLEQGRSARALEHAERAQDEGRGDRPEWHGLVLAALVQASLGRWDEAEKTAERLLRRTESIPTQKEKRRHLYLTGELDRVRGDIKPAIEKLEKAQTMLPLRGFMRQQNVPVPQHVPIWFALASAYLAAGDDARAATWFLRVAESTTEHIDWPLPYVRSFYFLGKIHEGLGETEKASEYYRRFYDYWKDGDLDRERVEEARKKLGMT